MAIGVGKIPLARRAIPESRTCRMDQPSDPISPHGRTGAAAGSEPCPGAFGATRDSAIGKFVSDPGWVDHRALFLPLGQTAGYFNCSVELRPWSQRPLSTLAALHRTDAGLTNCQMQLGAAFILAAAISAAALATRNLDLWGTVAATAVGTVVLGFGGWQCAAVLLAFFASSSLLGRAVRAAGRQPTGKYAKGGQRDAGQV